MANGHNYVKRSSPISEEEAKLFAPQRRRATRMLVDADSVIESDVVPLPRPVPAVRPRLRPASYVIEIDEKRPSFFKQNPWILPFSFCMLLAVVGALVLLGAGAYQRQPVSHMLPFSGQTYPVQLGGSYDAFNIWENSNGPLQPTKAIPKNVGPYSVLGKPTVTVAFINKVLAAYGSPAAGKGQALYDYGVQYGIDPVYALAFFMHESSFGKAGMARVTKSLGNLRCIQTRPCTGPNGQGYAVMNSWEDGFLQWYKLIRNLYVAQWGRITIDAIIPKYAPQADHNDEKAYIGSVEHTVDVWRSGTVMI